MSDMHVTTIEDMREYAKGTVVELPPFAEGQPFVARVRRPSILALAKAGKIPNQLLSKAGKLFNAGAAGLDTDDENMLTDVYDIAMTIVKAALVSPTVEEIADAGLELSDNQIMAIFSYTQTGVDALKSFRSKQVGTDSDKSVTGVSE